MTRTVHSERVEVLVAPDGMSAWASVVVGAVAGAPEIDAALEKAGVCAGIDELARATLAAQLVDPALSDPRFLLALGQSPLPGRDGWFEPAFHVGIQPGHLASDGTMDFYDRELLKPAVAGQVLGRMHAPLPGVDGAGVRGEVRAAPPVRPASMRLEGGVAAEPDGVVRAVRAGVVVYVEGKSLDVSSQLVHRGNVDLRSGSLETGGSLTVGGDVMPSFIVRAGGDLVVEGSVDGATVIAGGNIQVKGGIQGGYRGAICARGGLTAHHADRATITVGGGVTLESATHCELSADWIQVSRVRGGRAAAQRSVVTHEAGSPRGATSTTLEAAAVLDPSLLDVVRASADAKAQRTLQRQSGGPLRGDGARSKGGKLGLAAARREQDELQRKVLLARSRATLLATAFVEVGGTAYSGTMIVLGEHRLLLERDVSAVRFSVDPDRTTIRQSPTK